MKTNRISGLIAAAVLLSLCCLLLVGCQSSAASQTQPTMPNLQPSPTVIGMLQDSNTVGERTITIDAAAPKVEDTVYSAVLMRDEEGAHSLADELILSRFDQVEQMDTFDWLVYRNNESVRASFHIAQDNWTTGYVDYEYDQEGELLDSGWKMFSDYITPLIPKGSTHTPNSAAQIACEFFDAHSQTMTFKAYNVLAKDPIGNEPAGFYEVYVQGCYRGIPISRNADYPQRPITANAYIGNNGMFSFQGLFLLKEASVQEVHQLSDVDSAMQHLCSNFYLLTNLLDIRIDTVELQYFASAKADGSYELRPVWVFKGSGKNEGADHRNGVEFIYFADDGTFCGVFATGVIM